MPVGQPTKSHEERPNDLEKWETWAVLVRMLAPPGIAQLAHSRKVRRPIACRVRHLP